MKKIPLLLLTACAIISCGQKEVDLEVLKQEIREIHLATYTQVNDSNIGQLYYAARLLNQYPDLPNKTRAYNSNLIGNYHRQGGALDSASIYFTKAMELSPDTLALESSTEFAYFYNAWDTYSLSYKYGDCITVADEYASRIQANDSAKQAWLNFFYAEAYYNSGEFQNAQNANTQQQLYLRNNVNSAAYANSKILEAKLAYYFYKQPQRTISILNLLGENRKNFDANINRQIFGNLAIFEYYQEDFIAARTNYIIANQYTKEFAESPQKTAHLGTNYANLCEVHIDLKRYAEAQKYLDTIYNLGLSKLPQNINKSYLKYNYRIAAETGKSAKQITQLTDSLSNYLYQDYREKYTQELEALTAANEKEKELLAIQQEDELNALRLKNRIFLLVGLLVLLSGLGMLFYRQRKLKFERAGLQMQQRLLRSQMNPHFTFNTLYAIQRQIKDSPKIANEYLLKFSRLLRLILENSMQNYVLLEDELESIKKYMELQLLRFPEKFTYTIELNGMQEDDPIYIPPMLMQPFVENAIEHGFANIEYPGEIQIVLTKQNKYVSCNVNDNGTVSSNAKNKDKKSASTQLISDFLTKVTGSGVFINHVNHQSQGQGTQVQFLIPIQTNAHD